MYSEGKYVVGEVRGMHSAIMSAVLIPETITHSDISGIFETIRSAGFYYINIEGDTDTNHIDVTCYGESVSLGVISMPEDIELVRRTLGLGLD